MSLIPLHSVLLKHAAEFHKVVPFIAKRDTLFQLDFTIANTALTEEIVADTELFSVYIKKLLSKKYSYGIGGYAEQRTIYSRGGQFNTDTEPRNLHLGIDVWGPAGTPVYAPLGGSVHSFAFNDHFGDYGATIILHHQLDSVSFNTLYGHLSLRDIAGLKEGHYISRGEEFGHFGSLTENGNWPPHLHFQIIAEMHEKRGDYPGVCKYSEREKYLQNCPNPDSILQLMQYVNN